MDDGYVDRRLVGFTVKFSSV